MAPQQELLEINHRAKKENPVKIDRLPESVTSGEVSGPLLAMLSGKATELQCEQEKLKLEERQLQQALIPLHSQFDATALRNALKQFDALYEAAEPAEMQRLVRTLIHRIEWNPSGEAHAVEFYALAKTQNQPSSQDKGWLESVERPIWPRPRNCEPLIYRLQLAVGKVAQVLSASVRTLPNFNVTGDLQSVGL